MNARAHETKEPYHPATCLLGYGQKALASFGTDHISTGECPGVVLRRALVATGVPATEDHARQTREKRELSRSLSAGAYPKSPPRDAPSLFPSSCKKNTVLYVLHLCPALTIQPNKPARLRRECTKPPAKRLGCCLRRCSQALSVS